MRRGHNVPATAPRGTTPPDPSSPKAGERSEGNNWIFVLIFVVVCAIAFAVRAAAAPDAAAPQTTTTTAAYHGSRVRLPDGAQTITLKPEAARQPGALVAKSTRDPAALLERLELPARKEKPPIEAPPAPPEPVAPKFKPVPPPEAVPKPRVPAAPRTATPCSEEAWLTGLRRPCGLDVDPAVMKGTCCAFREPLPENAWTAPLNVPNETTRKAVAARPLWGLKHNPANDVVVGLAFGYAVDSYKMFVGSLRKAGFTGDIALSVSPEKEMKRHVAAYLKNQHVLAYPFKFTCGGPRGRKLLVTPGGCVLDDWYRDRDARGPRPLAISRYEMYETWLRQYSAESYILDLDTRDTFFQADPFLPLAARRSAADHAKDLYVFEEDGLKTTGTCKWNKGWLRCFEAAKWHTPETWTQPVRCSGSTLGSRDAMLKYVDAMLSASDEWLCHRTKGIPSDQGYHNYLILSGAHARNGLRVVSEPRGSGVVHTIGAMNGNSVPMELLGPLDTKWKVRDPVKGFITNTDGSRSPVVHQWDRWAGEMKTFLTKAFVTDSFVPGKGELYARPFEFVAYDPKTCADHPFVTKHKKGCDRLRAENADWVSQAGLKATQACCKFGGGIKKGA